MMYRKIQEKKTIKKILSIFLALTLLATIVAANAMPMTLSADEVPSFEIVPGSREADYDTSTKDGFINDKKQDGRIWTDKSVEVDGAGAGFVITLSALSQVFEATDNYVVPADTVFIIDVSGSMRDPDLAIDGRRRIEILVDALNEAIDILMAANPDNRIAVVAYGGVYGGHARAENVLPLGRYEFPAGYKYFRFERSDDYLYVDPTIASRPGVTSKVLAQASTPTQWGILLGAKILTSASNLTIPAKDDKGVLVPGVTVTRKPTIILMTDGEPTMAWPDYLFEKEPVGVGPDGILLGQAQGTFYGDGSNGEVGVSLYSVLTAAHRKRLVKQYYFDNNPDHKNAANSDQNSVGFYTVSLNDVPAPPLIAAAMFPFDPLNTAAQGYADKALPELNQAINEDGYPKPLLPYQPTYPNVSMGTLLRSFTNPVIPQTISFYARYRVVHGTYRWEAVNFFGNTQNLTLRELAYSDAFFPANNLETLRKAFESITTDIERKSLETVTDANAGDPRYGGYLVFSDILGDYMKFEKLKDFKLDGKTYSRVGFATGILSSSAARAEYEEVIYQQLNYGDPSFAISKARVTELVNNNINSGHFAANESIKYYANKSRDLEGLYFKTDGTVADPPANAAAIVELFHMKGELDGGPLVPGGETYLGDIVFHVIEAIKDGQEFEEVFSTNRVGDPLKRKLSIGDQMIRWYIPAAFIPHRELVVGAGGAVTSVIGQERPIQISYSVVLDEVRVGKGISKEYWAANQVSGDNKKVYFYSNLPSGDVAYAFYQPHPENPYYNSGGQGQSDRTLVKERNVTATAAHVSFDRHSADPVSGRMDLHWLGNNGRLTVEFTYPEEPPCSLTIAKKFTGDIPQDTDVFSFVSPIKVQVVGVDSLGNEIYREIFDMNATTFPYNSLTGRYEMTLTGLEPGIYRVSETGGNAPPGFIFGRPEPPKTATITTPGGYAEIEFVNNYTIIPPPPLPALTVKKVFHGLTDSEKPSGFAIRVTGPGGFDQRLNLTQAEEGRTFVNLAIGDYVIDEMNSDVTGFVLSEITVNGEEVTLPYTVKLENATANISITIDNTYTPTPRGDLIITKKFLGLPTDVGIFDFVSPVTFLVVGYESGTKNEIYREIVPLTSSTYVWDPIQSYYKITLKGLPLGDYYVTESGGFAPGYILPRPIPQLPQKVEAPPYPPAVVATFDFVNNYSPNPTPPILPSLTVRKVFHGLLEEEIPSAFAIQITGPGGFNEKLTLTEALDGKTFQSIAIGEYTVDESGTGVPGLVITEVSVNGLPVQLPFTVLVDSASAKISLTIDNYYKPKEPLASLTIIKRFEGLPSGDVFNLDTPIKFRVEGKDNTGKVIYNEIFTFDSGSVVWNSALGRYEMTINDLPLGNYLIYETGGETTGFVLNRPGPPEDVALTVPGGHGEVSFLNRYNTPPGPSPTPPPSPPESPPRPSPPPTTPTPPPDTPPPTNPPTDPPTDITPPDPPEGGLTPPPPPPPPSIPQTDDNRPTTGYIALLIAGFGLMGAAILYGLREKVFYRGKHAGKRK